MSDNRALNNASHLSGSQRTTELRTHRRYPITLAVQYKWNDKRAEQLGSGVTINISSGGVLFRSTEILPVKSLIELALSWPVALDQCALKLVMRGRVVRSASYSTAVRVAQYEFRTAGGRLPARLFPKIS